MAGTARVVIKTSNDGAGFREATSDAEKFERRLTTLSAIGTAGMVGLAAAALKVGMDFEHSMDQVGAVAGATAAEMDALTAKAKTIGSDTAFSASQAAGAMEELAASGLAVKDILNGGADAAVALAAAGNVALPTAARIAATAMSSWKIEGQGVVDVTNRIAAAANVSRFGVEDMGQAFGSAAATAAALNVGLPETSAAIAALADATNSGADAGTSFKTFLLSLPGSSEAAKKAIKEAGLEFFDLNGNLKPLPAVIQELHDKLNGLSQREKLDLVNKIFGSDGGRAALDLMQMTGAEFQALMDTMGNTSAADIAAQRMSNTKGSIEELKGSLETAAITLSDSMLPALAGAAQGATGLVNAFGALPDSTQQVTFAALGLAAALPSVVQLSGKAAEAALHWKTGLSSVGVQAGIAGAAIGGLAIGLDLLLTKTTGYGLWENIFGNVEGKNQAKEFVKDLTELKAAADSLGAELDPATAAMMAFKEGFTMWGESLSTGGGEIDIAGKKIQTLTTELQESDRFVDQYEGAVQQLGEAMMAAGAKASQYREVHESLTPRLQAVFDATVGYERILGKMSQAESDARDGLYEMEGAAFAAQQAMEAQAAKTDVAATAMDGYAEQLAEADDKAKKLKEILDGLNGAIADNNPVVIEAQAMNALLKEELQDLESKVGPLTEAEAARIGVIKQTIAENDRLIAGYVSNQQALEDLGAHLQFLMGDAGYLGLRGAMAAAGRDQESQIDIVGRVRSSYMALATGDIPTAISQFQALKEELSPDEWATLAAAVGPAVLKKIQETASGPERDALVAAFKTIGIDVTDGMSEGMEERSSNMVARAQAVFDKIPLAIRILLGIKSPSMVFKEIGTSVVDGFAEGVESGTYKAVASVAAMGDAVIAEAKAKFGGPFPGEPGGHYVGSGIAGNPYTGPFPSTPGGHYVGGTPSNQNTPGQPTPTTGGTGPGEMVPVGNGVFWDPATKTFRYIPGEVLKNMPGSAPAFFGGKPPSAASPGAPGWQTPNEEVAKLYDLLNDMTPAMQDSWLAANPWAAKLLQGHGYDLNIGTGIGVTAPTSPYMGGAGGIWGDVTMPNAATGAWGTDALGRRIWGDDQMAKWWQGLDPVTQLIAKQSLGESPDAKTARWDEALKQSGQVGSLSSMTMGGGTGTSPDSWAPDIRNIFEAQLPWGVGGVTTRGNASVGDMATRIWMTTAMLLGLSLEEAMALVASGYWKMVGWHDGDNSDQLALARHILETGSPYGFLGKGKYSGGKSGTAVRRASSSGGVASMRGSGGGDKGTWYGGGGNTTVIVNSPVMTSGALRDVYPDFAQGQRLSAGRSFAPFGGRR